MEAEYILRQEHKEFAARQDAENTRQNKRIDLLEENVRQIQELAAAIEKLAVNMENMIKVQEQQAKRLEEIEGRDGEMWRKISGYVITAVIGIVVGVIFNKIGF